MRHIRNLGTCGTARREFGPLKKRRVRWGASSPEFLDASREWRRLFAEAWGHVLACGCCGGSQHRRGLAQLLAKRGIRANVVAPGTVWTPLILSTMPAEKVEHFGEQVPMKRPAQPKELAPVYVLLASDEAKYIAGATVAVTGGKPII
jgi:Enoyl-(Acyl carrier protein) reductase